MQSGIETIWNNMKLFETIWNNLIGNNLERFQSWKNGESKIEKFKGRKGDCNFCIIY